MKLEQKLMQQLNQQQLMNVAILQMSSMELKTHLQELAVENPLIDPEEEHLTTTPSQDSDLLYRLRWLEDNDYQNYGFQTAFDEDFDPLFCVSSAGGLDETLERFLVRQISCSALDKTNVELMRFLFASLDDNGYLRSSISDLAAETGCSYETVENAVSLLRSLNPAGVGAFDLADCLCLQLQRIGADEISIAVAKDYLPQLAKHHYQSIATKLGVPIKKICEAEALIRELEPRPASMFSKEEQVSFIYPDIIVNENEGNLSVCSSHREKSYFHINTYYRNLLYQSDDREVKEYLATKMRQAELLRFAIDHRTSTLLRCAEIIVMRQKDFFLSGKPLLPLNLSDIAQELSLHESTVSRAMRDKYLQCKLGTYPLRMFLSHSISIKSGKDDISSDVAQNAIKEIINAEDRTRPLSDQAICEQLVMRGCMISRRTVAKYRNQMKIPDASTRRLKLDLQEKVY